MAGFWFFWFLLPLLLSCVEIINCEQRNYRIVFDDVNLKHWAPDLVEVLKFQLIQANNRSYISGQMILRQNIEAMQVRTRLDIARPQSKKVKLYDVRLDACEFMKTVHSNRLFNVFAKSFLKHLNHDLTCPIIAHFNYSLDKWYMDEQDFPSYIPVGDFGTTTEYFVHKKMVFRACVSGRIIPTK